MKRKVIVIIGLFMLIYFALHSTPTLAVRTALFFEGHPKVATGEKLRRKEI